MLAEKSKQLLSAVVKFVMAVWLGMAAIVVSANSSPLGINPNFSSIPISTEESVGEIVGITQDFKGFIWVVGSAGVARYDGYRFHTYEAALNELGRSFITDVRENSYKELWISSANGAVAKLDRERDAFRSYRLDSTGTGAAATRRFDKIYEDEQKNLWFTGMGGIALYDRQQDKLVSQLEGTELIGETAVDMIQVTTNEYLFATSSGVFFWDRLTDQIEHFVQEDGNPSGLPHSTVRAFTKDAAGNVWLGHGQGLCRFIRESKTFESVKIEHAVKERKGVSVWRMLTDKNGLLWLGTDGNGLMYFDPVSREFGGYTKNVLPSSLGTSVVRSIFQDNLGDFWIGGYPAGLYHYNGSNNFFSIYANFIRDKNDVYKNHVWAFSEDKKHNLWLGVDSIGLVYFDRKENTFTQQYEGFDFSNKGFPYTVLSMLEDSKGNLWLGSWAQGVTRFNLASKTYTHFNPHMSDEKPFVAESVWDIMEAKNGELYFSTMNNGFIKYSYETDKFTQVKKSSANPTALNSDLIWSTMEAKDGRIWIATFDGINIYDPATGHIEHFNHNPNKADSLSSDRVNSFYEDAKGRLWIATLGGGLNLYHPNTNTFSHIGEAEGLHSDGVQTVVEDQKGILWLSTIKGVSSYNPDTQEIQNYSYKNWLQKGAFSRGSVIKLKNGSIAFGGDNGFNILAPERVTSNTFTAPVYLTELTILNKKVNAQAKNSVLEKDIVEADKIVLTYEDTMVSLAFTSLNYRVYDDNQYRYKLQGLDSEWHLNTDSNKAIYTHLPAGRYKFLLTASNDNNVWGEDTKSVDIIVLPAPWRTWWAYTLYFGLAITLVAWYLVGQRRKIQQAQELNDKLIELDKLKDDFLANTSHELKTPLNGIIGITQALQDGSTGALSVATQQSLGMIMSCGRRLERLVGNILDFSKSKSTDIDLELSCENIAQLIDEVVTECRPTLVSASVKLFNTVTSQLVPVYCDAVRTQQIFYNIIANAIKFTESGTITISANITDTSVDVSVQDTGIGIAADQLSQLYTSFTQLTESGAYAKNGTGLSLAMTKYFVDLQGGELSVTSKLGFGSTFTVSLPRATKQQIATIRTQRPIHQNAVAKDSLMVESGPIEPLGLKMPDAAERNATQGASLPVFFPPNYDRNKHYSRVLVVDDESINRMVLREMLVRRNFIVNEASNGQEVVDALVNGYQCDLILLDIMMPKLSGTDACREIRGTFSAEELPIIFVSAKSQVHDMVECFQIDGNDFLSKPVNRDELLARVEAHIKFSQHFRELQKQQRSKVSTLN